ncbi:hypothetical protein OROHE_018637 [Orobanche hederae]
MTMRQMRRQMRRQGRRPKRLKCELLLALHWGPSKGCQRRRFYIHGGWQPPNAMPAHPCVGEVRNFGSRLRKMLSRCWPNLKPPFTLKNELKFWTHEWRKHGRFTGMSLRTYFRTIVGLYRRVPKYQDLGLELDVPEEVGRIRALIRQNFAVPIGVEVNGHNYQSRKVIRELRFRVNRNRKFVDTVREYSGQIYDLTNIVELPSVALPPGAIPF